MCWPLSLRTAAPSLAMALCGPPLRWVLNHCSSLCPWEPSARTVDRPPPCCSYYIKYSTFVSSSFLFPQHVVCGSSWARDRKHTTTRIQHGRCRILNLLDHQETPQKVVFEQDTHVEPKCYSINYLRIASSIACCMVAPMKYSW